MSHLTEKQGFVRLSNQLENIADSTSADDYRISIMPHGNFKVILVYEEPNQ